MKDNTPKPWIIKIAIDGKTQYLGTYATEEEAARAFDAKAAKHGRKLNFPDEWEDVEDIEEEEEEEEEEEDEMMIKIMTHYAPKASVRALLQVSRSVQTQR